MVLTKRQLTGVADTATIAAKLPLLAIAEEFIAKYLGGRFEPLADIPGHSEIVK
ncbi:hypothetical protein [Nostoc sp.]|uniref:hypothetical protein n=1 Tax=Nostoc sp. TaxID=1180 RepID=UPI002FF6BC26